MIRTGYIRWEIEATDARSEQDVNAREASFKARPTFRVVRVKDDQHVEAAEQFASGLASYDTVLSASAGPSLKSI